MGQTQRSCRVSTLAVCFHHLGKKKKRKRRERGPETLIFFVSFTLQKREKKKGKRGEGSEELGVNAAFCYE